VRSKAEPSKTRSRRWLTQVGLVVVSAMVVFVVVRAARQSPARSKSFAPTIAPPGMAWIPGGEFSMGCDDPRDLPHGGHEAMTDARPIHRVSVDGFWIDQREVSNDQFARFVEATGYITVAERAPTAAEFPTAPPENLVAGSVVFTPPTQPVPLDDHYRW